MISIVILLTSVWHQNALAATAMAFCDRNVLRKNGTTFDRVLAEADADLKQPPVSVFAKTFTAPSGDRHDYVSIGFYAWPDPTAPGGTPWKIIDGKENKDRLKMAPDSNTSWQMAKRVRNLATAYALTGNEAYAKKSAEFIRAWYLDSYTRMNPNLNFAQGIPGKKPGTPFGIIEGLPLVSVLESIRLLESSPSWKPSDTQGMKAWMTQFRDWLKTSPLGIEESSQPNNHGSWYDAQLATIEYFLGNTGEVKKIVLKQQVRIAEQIRGDGSQPRELKRTRPLHYSYYNLTALTELALLGNRVGVNLWDYEAPSGASLKKAIEYLNPCVTKNGTCPFKVEGDGVETFRKQNALRVIRQANFGILTHPYNNVSLDLDAQLVSERLESDILCLPKSIPTSAAVDGAKNATVSK